MKCWGGYDGVGRSTLLGACGRALCWCLWVCDKKGLAVFWLWLTLCLCVGVVVVVSGFFRLFSFLVLVVCSLVCRLVSACSCVSVSVCVSLSSCSASSRCSRSFIFLSMFASIVV